MKRLRDPFTAAFASADVKAAMARQENEISPTTPEAVLQFFKTEQARYGKLVKKGGIALE